MPMLVKACPSFSNRWAEHRAFYAGKELLYVALGEFAHHLVELQKANRTEEFGKVFDLIERMHLDGDPYVKDAATIAMLEGIQLCLKGFKMSLGIRGLSLNSSLSI